MKIPKIDISKVSRFVQKNLPSIMAGINAVGAVATGILGVRAGFKLKELYSEEDRTPTKKAVVKTLLPVVAAGAATVGSGLYSNKLHVMKEHALAGAFSGLTAYCLAMEKKLADAGQKDLVEVSKQAVLAEKAAESIPDTVKVNLGGKTLVYEPYTKQYIWTTVTEVQDAMIAINKNLCIEGEVFLNTFIDLIGGDSKKDDGIAYILSWSVENETQLDAWEFFGYYAPWVDISIRHGAVGDREVNYIYYEVFPQSQNPEDLVGYEYSKHIRDEMLDSKTYIPAEEGNG